MTRSPAITSNPMTMISPPTDAYGEGDSFYDSSETAGRARIQVNPGLRERDRMNKTYQVDGVECDWQTVFWRIPTPPHRSDNLGVPSSTKVIVSSQISAGPAKSSPSGLESQLGDVPVVTLGEQLSGEMMWERTEDLRSSNLYSVSLVLFIQLMLGD